MRVGVRVGVLVEVGVVVGVLVAVTVAVGVLVGVGVATVTTASSLSVTFGPTGGVPVAVATLVKPAVTLLSEQV